MVFFKKKDRNVDHTTVVNAALDKKVLAVELAADPDTGTMAEGVRRHLEAAVDPLASSSARVCL